MIVSICIVRAHLTLLLLFSFFFFLVLHKEEKSAPQRPLYRGWSRGTLHHDVADAWHKSALRRYFGDAWNRLDWVILLLYAAGLVTRLSGLTVPATQVETKVIHTLLCICLWIRFMRYYALIPQLGEFSVVSS